jgi:hypothetical protein
MPPKFYMHFILVFVVAFSTATTYGQNIQTSTIAWTCPSTFHVAPGTFNSEVTNVTSSPTQIVWVDSSNNALYTLAITETIGSWSNVNSNGSIIYKVTSGSDSGIVQFSKTGSDIWIRIHISTESEQLIYQLTVSDVNSL